IRMIETKTWKALRTATSTTDTLAAATRVELVQPLEDRDRLGAQLAVGRAVVLVRELAHAKVELRVADLAVLRLLRRLERAAVVPGGLLAARPQQRPRDDVGHD